MPLAARRQPTVPRSRWTRAPARRVRAIRDRLRELYGRPVAPPHHQGVEELILTVLSQSTNDRNRDVAFLRLRDRFPSWEAVRDAPLEEVEEAIQPGGLHRQKSVRIQEILRALPDPITLDALADMPVEEGRASLTALPGVGRKTAACVLLFAYGKPDVPVDTHVSRVGTRLGLFRPGAPFEELHDDMLAMVAAITRGDEEDEGHQELELHINLLRHGRRTCHAQRPDCGACALRRMCPYARATR
jgi:endonuclease III